MNKQNKSERYLIEQKNMIHFSIDYRNTAYAFLRLLLLIYTYIIYFHCCFSKIGINCSAKRTAHGHIHY